MKNITHYINNSSDEIVFSYEKFDAEQIKNDIIKYLTEKPNEMLDLYKVVETKEFDTLVDIFEVNPKNNKVSKIVTKGTKEFYKSLEN